MGTRRRNLAAEHLSERLAVGIAAEQPSAGEPLPEHNAGGKHVGASIDRVAADLLGGHVCRLSLEQSRPGGHDPTSARATPKSVSRASQSARSRCSAADTSRCTIPSGAPSSSTVECAASKPARVFMIRGHPDLFAGGQVVDLQQAAAAEPVDVLHHDVRQPVIELPDVDGVERTLEW